MLPTTGPEPSLHFAGVSQVSRDIFDAVWGVVTRRSIDRAVAATALAERILHTEGQVQRRDDELVCGDRTLNKDRELLPAIAQATGLGIALYAGNRRVAAATVLDAGTAPELDGFAASDLLDKVLRRREVYKGEIEYDGRPYISVARPLYATGELDYAPIGIVEAFQDKHAYFDLLSAAARAGVEDQLSGLNERAYAMESIITFIDDTARRLQLLALNGNIIAAQAGEQGRAFRVVCRELGSLADAAKLTASDVRRLAGTMGLDRLDAGEIMSTEGHGFGHTSASTSTESAIVDESSRTSGDER